MEAKSSRGKRKRSDEACGLPGTPTWKSDDAGVRRPFMAGFNDQFCFWKIKDWLFAHLRFFIQESPDLETLPISKYNLMLVIIVEIGNDDKIIIE